MVDDLDVDVRNKILDRTCLVNELSGGQFVLVNEAVKRVVRTENHTFRSPGSRVSILHHNSLLKFRNLARGANMSGGVDDKIRDATGCDGWRLVRGEVVWQGFAATGH